MTKKTTHNWQMKKLGEVSKINYGYTEKASFKEIGPKFLRITDIQDDCVDWEAVPFCKIAKDELSKYLLSEGDIVFARTGATTGKSFLLTNPPLAVFASYLIKLRILDLEILAPRFLFLFFQTKTYWDKIETGLSGSAQGGFNATKLAEISIPLPPIPEQQRIVTIMDEAFGAITKAKQNAERNLRNVRELFESYLQSVFANPGDGWEEKRLGEVCIFKGGGTPSTKVEKYWKGKIPWVSPKDMKSKFISDSQDHVSNEAVENSAISLISKGSILIVVRSGILARVVPIAITERELTINQDLKAICPNKNIDSDYLYYFFQGKMLLLLTMVSRGATVHRLTTDHLRGLSIGFPPLPEQRSIVSKLDALSAETQKLEALYRQKLADLDELKKSVLQKAFTGQLTMEN